MPIFPINRRVPILFGKIFCLFDSFITQDPPKMRGCLRPAPSFNDHDRRIAALEEHAEEMLAGVNALADATHRGFTNVNADLDQTLRLLQGLTAIVDNGFKTAFDQTTELRAEMQQEFAVLNAKVDQVLAALTGRPRR